MPKLNLNDPELKRTAEQLASLPENTIEDTFDTLDEGEDIGMMLYLAYNETAETKAHDSDPCSICRGRKESGKAGKRAHFHGSELGACVLKTYKTCLQGVSGDNEGSDFVSQNHPALLTDGHLHEAHMLDSLISAGLSVVMAKNQHEFERWLWVGIESGKPVGFTVPGAPGMDDCFRIIGHFDGLLERDGKVYLLECKSVKDYTWNKIKKERKVSPIWFGQVQCYLTTLDLEDGFFLIKSRHTSEMLLPIPVKKDRKYVEGRLAKLKLVYEAIVSGDDKGLIRAEHNDPEDSECKFCPYASECYG
jgi:hypothetical protein